MKKKLIQILMLLVATVSVGSFVSCKDTNEDLYNELRTKSLSDDATLRDALNARIGELEGKIAALETWKDGIEAWKATIKSCGCPDDVAGLIAGLQQQIDDINDVIKTLAKAADLDFYTKAEVDAKVKGLQDQIDAINAIIGTLAKAADLEAYKEKTDAALQTITKTIADLQVELEKARCQCDPNKISEILERLAVLETKMAAAEENIKKAMADAEAAKEVAQKAEQIANAATAAAQSAIEAAAKASEDAAKAAADAANAATTAAVAKEVADKAWELANTALTNANTANSIATEALTLAKANDEAIKALRTELQNNTQELREAIDKNKDAISELNAKVAANTEKIAADAEKIATNAANIQKNAEAIDKVKEDLAKLQTEVTLASADAKKALEDAAAAAAKADANSELISKLTERVAVNETNIQNLQESVKSLQETVSGLKDQVTENTTKIKALEDALKKTDEKVDDLSDKYTELYGDVEALKEELKKCQETCKLNLELASAAIRLEMQQLKTELVDRISKNEQAIEDLQKLHDTDVEWIKEALRQLGQMINECSCERDLSAILERIEALEKADVIFNERVGALEEADKQFAERIKELVKTDEELGKLIESLQKADEAFDERLSKDEKTIGELKEDVKTLKETVVKLDERISKAEEALNELTPKVNTLTTDVAAIQEYLRSQVTGMLVQGTYNPMFGSFSIPANVQSNVIVAYYGKPMTKIEFPTTKDNNYVRKSEVLTDADWDMIGDGLEVFKKAAGLKLINEDENGDANAGKIYVTVNPTSFDATGLQLELVNTQDVKAPFTLSPLQKSDATLQFGFSRADNGFYETTASIKKGDLESIELAFSEENLNELIEEARMKMYEVADNFFNTTGASGDLGGLATKIYNIIHDLRMDQHGLKCPYKDIDGNEQALYSQYNIAATVLRPLNLASFKDLHYYTIPGYEEINDFLDKIAETLNGHVHVMFTDANGSWKINHLFNGLKIDGIDLADYTNNLIAHFNARVSSFTLNGINYTLTIPGTGILDIKFDTNLTAGGSKVNVPEAIAYDEANPTLTKATLVIGGDVTVGMTTTLVIPAVDGEGRISAYASVELLDVTAPLAGGVIQVNSTKEGTRAVAAYAGGAINATGYPATLAFDTIVGSNGSVNIPVITEISGDAQNIVDVLAKFTEEMNHTLAEINKYDDIIAGENGWINKFIDQYIRKYLDKINHTSVYFFNSINRRFGPFLCASNDYKGFKRLSTNKFAPTTLSKEGLKLYPTTKNMELIVPIARKHVAITDVFDETGKSAKKDGINKDNVKAINNQNEGLNKVIDGTERMIAVDASMMKIGYTYEVTFSVLDFEGNISTSRYYIKVTE